MTRRVSISEKSARAAMDALDAVPDFELSLAAGQALRELRSALRPSPKRVAAKRAKRSTTSARKKSKRDETAEIRRVVVEWADGRCDACAAEFTDANPAELDHFFGRGKVPQAVGNCWALCRTCHRQKTDNVPDAARWLRAFIRYASFHGFTDEAKRAERRLDALALTEQAAAVSRGEG